MTAKRPTHPDAPAGIWCCERREQCRWQCFVLSRGLAWGTVSDTLEEWRANHASRCGGRLVQLVWPAAAGKARATP